MYALDLAAASRSDLRRIGTEEGIALAEREGLAFMEASALTRENVEEAFVELVNKVCVNSLQTGNSMKHSNMVTPRDREAIG